MVQRESLFGPRQEGHRCVDAYDLIEERVSEQAANETSLTASQVKDTLGSCFLERLGDYIHPLVGQAQWFLDRFLGRLRRFRLARRRLLGQQPLERLAGQRSKPLAAGALP